jgi:hypothetical protein
LELISPVHDPCATQEHRPNIVLYDFLLFFYGGRDEEAKYELMGFKEPSAHIRIDDPGNLID